MRGSDYDLRDFAKLFKSSEARVLVEGDDCSLTSSKFENLEDVDEVSEQAADLVGVLNGIAKIRCRTFDKVWFSTVSRDNGDGSGQGWLMLFTKGVVRVEDENKLSDGLVYATCETETNSWISQSDADTQIRDALRFFSETPVTWWSLRKAYEVVSGSGKIQAPTMQKKGWGDRKEIERFVSWTHFYVHGELQEKRRPEGPKMTLEEARDFVRVLLVKWLSDKASNSAEVT